MQACQMLVEFVQGQGGGGQEAPPTEAPAEQPAMKSGGYLSGFENEDDILG